MNRLRILHLEDDADFSEYVKTLLALEQLDAELVLVSRREDFEAKLAEEHFDIIIADYLVPGYDGIQALNLVQKQCPGTPFLLVSGTIGEDAAIESLKAGATDYVLKLWPERLAPALKRAAREAEEKAKRQQMESELTRRERYFRTLTENSSDILTILSAEGSFIYNSPSLATVLGYQPEDLVGQDLHPLVHPDDLLGVLQALQSGMENVGQSSPVQFRCRHRDGSYRHLEAVGQNRLADPEIQGFVINSRDVTDRMLAQEELRQNEEQYRLIFAGNPAPMWIFDRETLAFLEVNDAAIEHYGYSREEFLSMTLMHLRTDEDSAAIQEYLQKLVSDPASCKQSGIWRQRKRNGSLLDVEMTWSHIVFGGRPACLALANDVTERRRIEHRDAALSKLGQSLSSATSPTEAARIIRDITEELFTWDVFTLDLYSVEQDLIFPVINVDTDRSGVRFEIQPGPEGKRPSGMARRIISHGAELILRQEPLVMPPDVNPVGDVTRASASLMLVPIRNRTRVIGVLSIQSYTVQVYTPQDLATLQTLADHCGGAWERIRAEHALRESQQNFRTLFEGSPDAIFVEDYNGVVMDVNPAACALHGMTRDALVGKHVSELVPPEARAEVSSNFAHLRSGSVDRVEGASWRADGVAVPVEVRANRIEYAGQLAVLLHVRDVTERKRAEAALRGSEMRFHSVWENSVDGMRLTDENGIILAVNEAYCGIVGMARADLEGRPFHVVYAASEQPERMLRIYRERFRKGIIKRKIERRLTLHDGSVVTLEDTNSFVQSAGEKPLVLSLFRDVTAQRRLEEQFRQSQKMEAIGQLAGGVAHDFNNILTVIHGHASLLLASGNLAGLASKSAEQVVQAAERAAGLTRQLLTFGRRQVMQPRRLDLNEVVCNMTKMLGRILGEDIALQLRYWPQPALVMADAGMVEQVLLNLAVNSRDAMPSGGVLSVTISCLEVDESQIAKQPDAKPGRYVCLAVADNGCGIPPENLPKIFEPFFTTKEVGKGTGLGLATVYGIVKQHEGWIEVESQVGKGAGFRIYLPANHVPAFSPEEQTSEQPLRGGNETILVVEDETPVRELVCSVLAGQGYKILQAESGTKALEVWAACKEKVDLLLTDVVMPDRINGRELAQRLQAERPHLKVLFTSGYSADVVGKDFVLNRNLNYLQKPYQPRILAQAVRQCLDAVN